jgi:hypothetical protein
MGKIVGEATEKKLGLVKDPDLRLLAQIQFAAPLCGLPELAYPAIFF